MSLKEIPTMATTTKPQRNQVATSLKVSPVCLELWNALARKQGLNRTAYLESTIRRLAREEGLDVDAIEQSAA
jgi:hypothetical protein